MKNTQHVFRGPGSGCSFDDPGSGSYHNGYLNSSIFAKKENMARNEGSSLEKAKVNVNKSTKFETFFKTNKNTVLFNIILRLLVE